MKSLKNRIRKIIFEKCDGSNKRFAEMIGVSTSTINLWDDTHLPKGDILQKIHLILNVDLHWLLTGAGNPYTDLTGPAPSYGAAPVSRPVRETGVVNVIDGGRDISSRVDSGSSQGAGGFGDAEALSRVMALGDQVIAQAFISNLKALYRMVEMNHLHQEKIHQLLLERDELMSKLALMEGVNGMGATGSGG